MEEYSRVAIEEIWRQWKKGIYPAIYNGYKWYKRENNFKEKNEST